MYDATFIQTRIDFYASLVTTIEATIANIAANPQKSYSINTGQTTETVGRHDLDRLSGLMEWAIGQYEFWSAKQQGGSTVICVPGW